MTTFDPEATIERAAEAIAAKSAIRPTVCSFDVASARAALSTIAADVLAPIEALHQQCEHPFKACHTCEVRYPCPTAQAVADIKAKAGVR